MKGGAFLPIYKREAMWIDFAANAPFLVKIYAGGINIISGEPYQANLATQLRQKTAADSKQSVQDYIVLPQQIWLDGLATSPGVVSQFVATAFNDGLSLEAQKMGTDSVGGFMFEITPLKASALRELTRVCSIFVKTLDGQTITVNISLGSPVVDLKKTIQAKSQVPAQQQRLIYAGKDLDDRATLQHYGVTKECTVHMVLRLRGGGTEKVAGSPLEDPTSDHTASVEMVVARGGQIKQSIHHDNIDPSLWSRESTMVFNVQLIDSTHFRSVTGQAPPPTPVTMHSYVDAGLPFFKMYEEHSRIHGEFAKVKSVNQLVNKKDKHLTPQLIPLGPRGQRLGASPEYEALKAATSDPDKLLIPNGPLQKFRTANDLEAWLAKMSINDFD